jgi:hypothetical protein
MAANIAFIALLFLVACGAEGDGAEWHSSTEFASGRLNAVWSGLASGFLNITQLDPITGVQALYLFEQLPLSLSLF